MNLVLIREFQSDSDNYWLNNEKEVVSSNTMTDIEQNIINTPSVGFNA